MANIVYQDSLVTEYDDGSEEVRFTETEMAEMMADPVRFGYALRCGHSINSADSCGDCMECEAQMSQYE